MRVATFNIYFLGGNKIDRSDAEYQKIGQVIAKLDADIIGFQEIMDPDGLQLAIDAANTASGRNYLCKNADGDWLTASNFMRVGMAFDADAVELKSNGKVEGYKRDSYALHVVDKKSGIELNVVDVHLKSGQPVLDDQSSADTRRIQCENLASWIAGGAEADSPEFPKPTTDKVILLGDFNAINDLDVSEVPYPILKPEVSFNSMEPLRTGPFTDWHWPFPLADDSGGRYSVYGERLMIDFIMFSPQLASNVSKQPKIYAFDVDPEIGIADRRVSDHRPIVAELDL